MRWLPERERHAAGGGEQEHDPYASEFMGFRRKINMVRPFDRLFECREKETEQGKYPLEFARPHIGVIQNASIPRRFRTLVEGRLDRYMSLIRLNFGNGCAATIAWNPVMIRSLTQDYGWRKAWPKGK